jgi:hypothetical protein
MAISHDQIQMIPFLSDLLYLFKYQATGMLYSRNCFYGSKSISLTSMYNSQL